MLVMREDPRDPHSWREFQSISSAEGHELAITSPVTVQANQVCQKNVSVFTKISSLGQVPNVTFVS